MSFTPVPSRHYSPNRPFPAPEKQRRSDLDRHCCHSHPPPPLILLLFVLLLVHRRVADAFGVFFRPAALHLALFDVVGLTIFLLGETALFLVRHVEISCMRVLALNPDYRTRCH